MSELSKFSKTLATLIPSVGGNEFCDALINTFRELVPVSDATIVVYPGTDLPVIEYFEVHSSNGRSTLDLFVKGAFLLDPYYLAASRDNRYGLFSLHDLAPSGFQDSEYYKTWYQNCGYEDECGYLIPITGEGFVNIALGRTEGRPRFDRQELDTLEAIRPAVDTLCQQHWTDSNSNARRGAFSNVSSNLSSNVSGSANLRGQMHAALDAFGSSVLTEREAQVINLVLHGHSTKAVAEKFSISIETVKLHRKHAYAKLEIGSQAELFYLFLDSLMSAEDYKGGDTLIAYLQTPGH